MATFVEVSSPTGNYDYVVNADRVTYIQQSRQDPDKCVLHFDGEHSLAIGMSAAEFKMRAAN